MAYLPKFMSSTMTKKPVGLRRFLLHPFLFAVYPILTLLAFNIAEVDLSSAWRPLLLSASIAGVLTLTFNALFRDWKRSALLATALLILFYSYGHVYIALKALNIGGFYLFRHRTMVPLWIGLVALLVWWISRKSFRT